MTGSPGSRGWKGGASPRILPFDFPQGEPCGVPPANRLRFDSHARLQPIRSQSVGLRAWLLPLCFRTVRSSAFSDAQDSSPLTPMASEEEGMRHPRLLVYLHFNPYSSENSIFQAGWISHNVPTYFVPWPWPFFGFVMAVSVDASRPPKQPTRQAAARSVSPILATPKWLPSSADGDDHSSACAFYGESSASAQARPERSLRLAGAAAALRQSVGAPLPPAERARLDNNLEAARQAVSNLAGAAAWMEGWATSAEKAIAYALSPD